MNKPLEITLTETGVRLSLFLFEKPIQLLMQPEDAQRVYQEWLRWGNWEEYDEYADIVEFNSNKTGFLCAVKLGGIYAVRIDP